MDRLRPVLGSLKALRLVLGCFEALVKRNDVYVHAGQHETRGTCNMSEAKQTLLFPGELGLSAHRVCRAIEIVPMHCKPYTTDGRWSSAIWDPLKLEISFRQTAHYWTYG